MRRREITILPVAIKTWRRERGWSQKELADRAGVSAGLIAMIEVEERQPSISNAIAIAQAIGIPLKAIAIVHMDAEAVA